MTDRNGGNGVVFKKKYTRNVPVMSAQEAVEMVPSGAVVSFSGAGGGILEPTALIQALAERFEKESEPRDLTFFHTAGLGDRADKGMSVLAKPGLCKCSIGSHYAQSPAIADMAVKNEIEAYCFPMGVMTKLTCAAASGQPGVITKIGIGTFIDPRNKGGKLNEKTKEDLVQLVNIDGEEYLFYKAVKPDVAFIRGTTADEEGYITLEDEPVFMNILGEAQAAKNNGGIVIAQVKRVVKRGTLHPKKVKVPGYLIDALVVVPDQEQLYNEPLDRFISGDYVQADLHNDIMPLNHRKVIARRALMEASPGDVGNVGVGIPDGVGKVAAEEGVSEEITLTVEHGVIGGVTSQGIFFGANVNTKAIIDSPTMFDFYNGGGLDIAFLSFAELDRHGNVNVSRFNNKIAGAGGFVDIAHRTKKVIFLGTFTAGGLETSIENGRIRVVKEGRFRKFCDELEEISFSSENALLNGQHVLYLTERASFRLTRNGIELFEIAEGMDLEKDILANMDFRPLIAEELSVMDRRLFYEGKMVLRDDWIKKGYL